MTSHGSAVEELDRQHRHLSELFEHVSSPEADRPAVLSQLVKDLAAHIAAERAIVEPAVKEHQEGEDEGDDLAAHLMGDYKKMQSLMVLIERRKSSSPDLPELVTELMDTVDEHIRQASEDLFPVLDEALSPEEQAELAERLGEAGAMTTTHPHPHLLALGPISDKLIAVLSGWDRMRDRTVKDQPPSGEPEREDPQEHAETIRREAENWRETTGQRGSAT